MKDTCENDHSSGKSTDTMMFRDLASDVQDLLKNLSVWGYIYIGRTGVGLTTSFRKETFKIGTLKATKDATQWIDDLSRQVLEVVAVEGPKWVPYKRIEEVVYGVKLPNSTIEITEK